MSDPKDEPPKGDETGSSGQSQQSGRVAFDARGNPIWEWQTETGKFGRNVSTQRLKKLEAKDLAIVDTVSVPKPKPKGLAIEEPGTLPGGGVNPYDTGKAPGGGINPYDTRKAPGARKQDSQRQSLVTKFANKPQPKREPESFWGKLRRRFFS